MVNGDAVVVALVEVVIEYLSLNFFLVDHIQEYLIELIINVTLLCIYISDWGCDFPVTFLAFANNSVTTSFWHVHSSLHKLCDPTLVSIHELPVYLNIPDII